MKLDILLWINFGVIATGLMTVFELIQLYFQGKKSVPEFYQNSQILARLLKKSWEKMFWYSFFLHFFHGILGAIVFGVIIILIKLPSNILFGILYGLCLWVILLIIHEPITYENIFSQKEQIIGSLFSHLLYGVALSILFIQ